MRRLLAIPLLAACLLPVAVQAKATRGEIARDRQEVREDRRDLNRAYRQGDRSDIRDARDDLRDSRRELNQDWRDYRRGHAKIYHRGNWRAPFPYQRIIIGRRLPAAYYGPRYVIANPGYYRLPPAYGATRWVRHYDDVLLIDLRTGIVRNVIRGFYW